MRDIWEEQLNWINSGEPFVLARVIRTWRSAPRKTGAGMLIGSGMKVAGSVSGGCIEGAVIEEGLEVLETGKPRLLNYGVEDDLALSVGLSCGGEVSVLVEKHWAFSNDLETKKVWDTLQNCIRNNQPAVLISPLTAESETTDENEMPLLVLPGKAENLGGFQNNRDEALEIAMTAYSARENRIVEIDGRNSFIQVFPRQDQLLIIGAGHITIPLVRFAKELDFMDTYAILLTHDPKIDDPALHILLKHDLPYIGALGSSRTHAKRCTRLEEAGIDKDAIKRIKGPAGADIGAQTAAEIALSMITEVIAAKRGKL